MSGPSANPGGRSPLLFIFLTVFIDLLGFGIVLPLLPIYSLEHRASEAEIGLLFGSFSAMQFLFAPLWGRLSDRVGRKPILVGGLFGTAGSYLLFAYAGSLPMLFASRMLAGFFGANVSTAQAYIADVTTPENRARGMGLIGAAFESMFTLYGIERFPTWFGMPEGAELSTANALAAAPWAGRYMGVIGLIAAVIQGGFIRRLVPRYGETTLATAGPAVLAVSLLVIAVAPSFWVVIAGCVLMPFGFGINNPALFGMISRASPAEEQGAYLGLNQSISSLARMVGPVLGGALFMSFGARTPFLVAAGILGTSAVIAYFYRRRFGASFPRGARAGTAELGG